MARRRLTEHLISLRTDNGVTFHAYGIWPAREHATSGVMSKLCEVADEAGCSYLPVLLGTELSTGGTIVRRVLAGHDDFREALTLAQKVLDGKDDRHLTIWWCLTGCADDLELMALH